MPKCRIAGLEENRQVTRKKIGVPLSKGWYYKNKLYGYCLTSLMTGQKLRYDKFC